MNRLLRPYPLERMSLLKATMMSLAIALFIGFFLYVFKPFNLHQFPGLLKASFLYGAVTFIATFLVLFFFPRWFKSIYNEEKWTVIKEIVSIAFLLFLIGVGNFFLGRYLFDASDATVANEFLGALYSTVAVGIIPTVIAVLFNQLRLEKTNTEQAKVMDDKISTRKVRKAQTQDLIEGIDIDPNTLVYAHAQGNYTDIYFQEKEEIKKHVQRITLTALEELLSSQSELFFRSHRSYLVNLNTVKHVEGNAQGYRLELQGIDQKVPVSRGNIEEFNGRVESSELKVTS